MTAVADVLNGAAGLIERDGWCQRQYRDENGCRCLAGAIDAVAGEDPEFHWESTEDAVTVRARHAVADVVGKNWSSWNDEPGRTKAEVVAVLRAAAERAS